MRAGRRLLTIGLVAAAVGLGMATAPPASAATLTLGMQACTGGVCSDAGLTPQFDPSISDYVVHCAGADSMVMSAQNIAPAKMRFARQDASGSSFTSAPFAMTPGHEISWSLTTAGATRRYYARCLPADFPSWTTSVTGTPRAQWFLMSPIPSHYAIVADAHGTPVWWMADPAGQPINVELINHRITWAASNGAFALTAHYTLHRLDGSAALTLGGTLDHHDLQRMPNGNYLAIRYLPRDCPATPSDCVDLSPWGGGSAENVMDGEIVELDAHNHELWSWNTRDHIALAETSDLLQVTAPIPDIDHVNSLQPDGNNALVFSARNLDAVYHVNMKTGAIDWKLGGTPTPQSLTVVGNVGPDPLFSGQHDARLLPGGTLTVHENGSGLLRQPRVLRFEIDPVNHTATLLESITDNRAGLSGCCGSARKLSGGDWVIAWGANSIVTELTPAGVPVLTMTLASGAFTYRAEPVEPGRLTAAALRRGMDHMSAAGP